MLKKIESRRRQIMSEPSRVTAEEVYSKLKSGKTLLVCAYEDEAKFKKLQLEGAISLSAFQLKLPSLSKDQEIVFYCGWQQEASAARQAAKYIAMGYTNAECLAGGVESWKKAGHPIINPE